MPQPTALIQVGKTELNVTRLGLGTAPIGNLYVPISESQAVEIIQYAYNQGLTLFDTAPLYGSGKSERFVGKALAGVPRDSFILSTKVGRLVQPDGSVIFDYSRDGIKRSIEASLERLQMDRIDILLIHDPDNHFPQALDEAYPVLADLRSQGVIKALGAGMNQWQMEEQFARNADIDCFLLAGRYTLLEQTSLDFLQLCREKNIGIFLGGVYNSGILATGPKDGAKYNYADAPPAVLDRARKIKAVCDRHNVPLNVAAIQFPFAHPAVTAAVVGAQTAQEVANNIESFRGDVPVALWADLQAEGLLAEGTPIPV
jgi:D-threo-aldose 1-dehydrogenase